LFASTVKRRAIGFGTVVASLCLLFTAGVSGVSAAPVTETATDTAAQPRKVWTLEVWLRNTTNWEFDLTRADVDCKGASWQVAPPKTLYPGRTAYWRSACDSAFPVNETFVDYRYDNQTAYTRMLHSHTGYWEAKCDTWPPYSKFQVLRSEASQGSATCVIVPR
jgi:hypothetical protein